MNTRLAIWTSFVAAHLAWGCASAPRVPECDALFARIRAIAGPGLSQADFAHATADVRAKLADSPEKARLVCMLALESMPPESDASANPTDTPAAQRIEHPAPDSSEWVVYKTIEAALVPDADEGYRELRPLLHSAITDDPAREEVFRATKYAAYRRAALRVSLDGTSGAYALDHSDGPAPDASVQLFVVDRASQAPVACRLARDPKQDNAWKLTPECAL